jgi:Tol biopolymer transport system component
MGRNVLRHLYPQKAMIEVNEVKIDVKSTYGVDLDLSPDGRYLAYSIYTEKHGKLFLNDTITGETRLLALSLRFIDTPRWSPDGKWLAYREVIDNDNHWLRELGVAINVISPESGEMHLLTSKPDKHFRFQFCEGSGSLRY